MDGAQSHSESPQQSAYDHPLHTHLAVFIFHFPAESECCARCDVCIDCRIEYRSKFHAHWCTGWDYVVRVVLVVRVVVVVVCSVNGKASEGGQADREIGKVNTARAMRCGLYFVVLIPFQCFLLFLLGSMGVCVVSALVFALFFSCFPHLPFILFRSKILSNNQMHLSYVHFAKAGVPLMILPTLACFFTIWIEVVGFPTHDQPPKSGGG